MKSLAVGLILCAAAGDLVAQVQETIVHSFGSFAADGYYPKAALIQGTDGKVYGTAATGSNNYGIVFRITPGGGYTILHSFRGATNDGSDPSAPLVQGTDGNFWGTTFDGGSIGGGTVFRISPTGDYTNLYSFPGSIASDAGFDPLAGLVQASDGNFYGTAYQGGTNGYGTVFQIGPNGGFRVLHDFGSFTGDGRVPMAGLIQGSDGYLYGTTQQGGTTAGTVFRITTNGVMTILHIFEGYPEGLFPQAGLVWGNDGYFYGTTSNGGTNDLGSYGGGIVFRMNPSSGDYAILHEFPAFTGDGENPQAGLVLGSDGNFYGTTASGGALGHGTVFQISPGGTYSNLYSFAGYPDGSRPEAGLVQGSDGSFYGTTYFGGTNKSSEGTGLGCVFKLTVPLNPPANQISGLEVAGTNVLISIPSVAGETYQLQYRSSLTSGAWSNVKEAPVTSLGGPLTITNVGGFLRSEQFYRFQITP